MLFGSCKEDGNELSSLAGTSWKDADSQRGTVVELDFEETEVVLIVTYSDGTMMTYEGTYTYNYPRVMFDMDGIVLGNAAMEGRVLVVTISSGPGTDGLIFEFKRVE